MIVDMIVDFAEYLKKFGYDISSDKIEKVLRNINDFSKEDMVVIMKPYFCSSKNEAQNLATYFDDFLKERTQVIRTTTLHSAKTGNSVEYVESTKDINVALENVEKQLQNIIATHVEDNESLKEERILPAEDKNFLLKNKTFITNIHWDTESLNYILLLYERIEGNKPIPYINNLELAKETAAKESKNSLIRRDMNGFNILKRLHTIFEKIEEINKSSVQHAEKSIKEKTQELKEQRESLKRILENAESEYVITNQEIEYNLRKVNVIQKKASKMHRDMFVGEKGNAVQIIGEGAPECIYERFKNLDDINLKEIYSYIRDNAVRFKTRLQKHVNAAINIELDMKETIATACKTCGLPLQLIHKATRTNRAKILMCLDISGSCSAASKLMLSFIYLMQNVFPGGCKAYVFVDSLNDISSIMKDDYIETAINEVFKTVPTRGVYSNYYNPIKELWTQKRSEITSDTFVIFIGDARNNGNASGSDYLMNIARRAKKAVWLNTEAMTKWGKNDSEALEYAKYFKMIEVITPAQLIKAVEEI